MKLTIRDIAEVADVPITTVSQILSNKGNRSSDKTRKKVLSIMNEHHHKPDYFTSNVINRHSKTVGMVVPDVTGLFFSKLIESIENYLSPLDYVIMLRSSRYSQENEVKYLQEPSHRSVDGVLLATPNILPEKCALDSDFYQKMPIILIDRGLNRQDNGRLIVKEYKGAYQAAPPFIESDHTKIGMPKEITGYYQLEEHFGGYRHTLKDHGLSFNRKFVEYGELTVQGGYATSKKLLKHKDITTIFCGNDAMAIGCYQVIDELGKRVPESISVMKLDGLKLSEYMTPQLTTVQQSSSDIGSYAARFLIDTIELPQRKAPNKVFETKLTIRESVEVSAKD